MSLARYCPSDEPQLIEFTFAEADSVDFFDSHTFTLSIQDATRLAEELEEALSEHDFDQENFREDKEEEAPSVEDAATDVEYALEQLRDVVERLEAALT